MNTSLRLVELAKTIIEEVQRNLETVQPGQLMYYKQILMYTLYALGYAVDALIISKTGTRPTGHGERINKLTKIGRQDLKKMYESLIVMIFSKLETVSMISTEDLKNIVTKVNEKINEIENEIKTQTT